MVQKIDIKDVSDFCWCPAYYDIKRRSEDECNLKEAYDQSLHKCFYSYLRALQNDTLKNTIEFLKYKWGKEWIDKKTNSEIALTPSSAKRDSYESKRKAGIDAIITFDKLMNVYQFPIIINHQYEVKLTDDIILTGTWEYVREMLNDDGTREFQILKFRTEDNKFHVTRQARHDLELTAASFAFNKTFHQKNPKLMYVDIYGKKLLPSVRSKEDYKMLVKTVSGVVQCIQQNIRCIYPDKRCYHCEYRNECLSK